MQLGSKYFRKLQTFLLLSLDVMILLCLGVLLIEWCFVLGQKDGGPNNKSPPCGLLHSNELYNNPNLTLVNEFSWVVALKYTRDDNYSEDDRADGFLCTGSLINSRYVLTSGSCVDGRGLKINVTSVRIGKYSTVIECVKNLQSEDCSASIMDIPVENVLIYPTYNFTSLMDNVALVELAQNVTFTEYVRPICLQPNPDANEMSTKKEFWTSGYLHDDPSKIIKAGNRVLISDEECTSYLDRSQHRRRLTKGAFCTREGTKGPCISDAGGPLAFPRGEQWYQEGISSFGTDCTSTSDAITTYARLSNYIDWIKETSAMES